MLTCFDSRSPNFWVYAGIAFWLVEMIVVLCLDLLFIRAVFGPAAWDRWRVYWGEKTHWGLALLNTVACSLVFGFLLLASFFGDNMSSHEISQSGLFALPALALFIVFVFFHSLFRDRFSRRFGAIAYGCFALLLLDLALWKWT
jgi:hypothetical protein